MTHTYALSGLTCSGCAAKVKTALLRNADISGVDIKLDPQEAVISMKRHVPLLQLQQAVSSAGNYSIDEASKNLNVAPADTGSRGWLATYKPLLVVFAFITGVALLTSLHGGVFHAMIFMRNFMAGFFLVFAFFKLLDLRSFAASYSTYDLLAKHFGIWGWIYPFIELTLGASFLTGFELRTTSWVTLVVMGFSSVGPIQSVFQKRKIRCACLGAFFNLPMSTVTIVEDLLMIAMAVAMLFFI